MRTLFAAAAIALIAAAPAAAAPTPGATYGGGTIPATFKQVKDTAIVAAEVGADGQAIKVVANTVLDCGKGGRATQMLSASGRLGPDGRLRFDARTRKYEFNEGGARPRGTATVDLGFDGATGSGTIRMVTRRRGSACDSTLPVQLRAAGADGSPAATPPGDAYLFGTGSASWQGVRVPVGLHVAPDAARVAVMIAGAPVRCRAVTDYLPNYSPPMRIGSGGRFSRTERFYTRFKGILLRTRFRVSGRFTAQGARGTYSARMRVSGSRVKEETCRTGTVRWTAVR